MFDRCKSATTVPETGAFADYLLYTLFAVLSMVLSGWCALVRACIYKKTVLAVLGVVVLPLVVGVMVQPLYVFLFGK